MDGARPAAWYRDPHDPAWHYRYWDDTNWTEHTAVIPQVPYSGESTHTYTPTGTASLAPLLVVPVAILLLIALFTGCSTSSGTDKDTPECATYRALLTLKDDGADLTWHEVENAGQDCRDS